MEGKVIEITSYDKTKALILTEESRLLKYGALAIIEEREENGVSKRYLAMVIDVTEKSIVPVIDSQNIQYLIQKLRDPSFGMGEGKKIWEQMFSPTRKFIKYYGMKEVILKVLGEISEGRVVQHARPPRILSDVREAEKDELQNLLIGDPSKDLTLGELVFNPDVDAVLNPENFNMHLAIVGQTGSGKTETVKRLVFEYAINKHKFSERGGIIIFDVAGEYTGYPYLTTQTASLLEAALHPEKFSDKVDERAWVKRAKKTIVIPIDLAYVPTKAEEEGVSLGGRIARFVSEINERYRPAKEFIALIFGRHGVYITSSSRNIEKINSAKKFLELNDEVKNLVDKVENLVIAMPLPNALDLGTIIELSKSTSEILPDAIETIALRLGLLDNGFVKNIVGLTELLLKLLSGNPKYLKSAGSRGIEDYTKDLVTELKKIVSEALKETEARDLEKVLHDKIKSFLERWGDKPYPRLVTAWEDLILALMREFVEGDTMKTPRELRDLLKEIAKRKGEFANFIERAIYSVAWSLKDLNPQTRSSLKRSLRNISWLVSPYLSPEVFRKIIDRVANSFTLVHLAPPSIGDNLHLASLIVKDLFRYSVENFEEGNKILLVVEEAHNLAPAGERRVSNEALLRVAREGRKWGLGLVLVSQRPGFIDPNVLSQAATLISLRVTNPQDIANLRQSVESVSQELLDKLPDLERGQAIISGVAVPERRVPLFVKVRKLEPL